MTQSLWLPDLQATQALGVALGQTLSAGTVLLLTGDLGSGKTTLIQSLGQGLGITDAIVSPTFTLIQEYPEGRVPLYHFDLYRLSPQEAAELHPDLYWQGLEVPLGIVAIEWPERLSLWPEQYLHLCLQHHHQGRQLDWQVQGTAAIAAPLLAARSGSQEATGNSAAGRSPSAR